MNDPKHLSKRAANWQKLLQLMRDQQPYLNNLLVQADIARVLHISNRTLSRIISENTGKNFCAFINDYRILEVKALMRDEQLAHLSLEAVARMAGFNSRAVFYRCFRQQENMNPSQYRAQFT